MPCSPDVQRAIEAFYESGKPIGAICISPVLLAKVLGHHGVSLTVGETGSTSKEIEKTGATHEPCPADEYVSDRGHKVLTTPAYMYDDAKPFTVFTGISKMIKELVEMA